MRVWRIARERFQELNGDGARLNGGRWNTEGNAVVYTSQTPSLAILDLLVHVNHADVPDDLVLMEIDVPDDAVAGAVIDSAFFEDPAWREYPAPDWQAVLGDEWLNEGTYLWLAVPSAVVPQERNILINPRHARTHQVSLVDVHPFGFDPRLF